MENFKINIMWWKVCLSLIITVFSCTPEAGKSKTYVYTIINQSGVNIEIIGYLKNYPPYNITLENGNEHTQIYKDGLPPRGYSWNFFYGANDGQKSTDSIEVIYNNNKKSYFSSSNYNDSRNPLYNQSGNTEDVYIFTQEDYNNAQDCNGNCN